MNKNHIELPQNFKRVNYYAGKMLTLEDFKTDQQYYKDRMKLHNRFLHGCGIVSGLKISLSNKLGDVLVVSPGYAIDPHGNDVILPKDLLASLPAKGISVYLVLRWAEREVDLMPSCLAALKGSNSSQRV